MVARTFWTVRHLRFTTEVRCSSEVTVVTINCLPRVLVFFVHPVLDKETLGGPVNFGLPNQTAPLHWIETNIKASGSGLSKMTIAG